MGDGTIKGNKMTLEANIIKLFMAVNYDYS